MRILLFQISSLQLGVPFRAGIEAVSKGEVSVIQTRDTSLPVVSADSLIQTEIDIKSDRHWILTGDILFRSRGLSMTTSIVREVPPKTIAAAPLVRIRVTATDLVVPEYLTWYLNQRPAQAYFMSNAKGTIQMMIDKNTLENLEVAIPPMECQRQIVAYSRLADREQELSQNLMRKRRKNTDALLLNLAENT